MRIDIFCALLRGFPFLPIPLETAVDCKDRDGRQRHSPAQGVAIGLVDKINAVGPCRTEHRHQALVHIHNEDLLTDHKGRQAIDIQQGDEN